jgi:adenosylmethionine-8-amino-7-oxononanoate aminotransferase
MVEDTRAIGLMGAVEPRADLLAEKPDLPARLVAALAARGVLTRALASGAIQLSPPLVIEARQIVELTDAIRGALDAIAGASPTLQDRRA